MESIDWLQEHNKKHPECQFAIPDPSKRVVYASVKHSCSTCKSELVLTKLRDKRIYMCFRCGIPRGDTNAR